MKNALIINTFSGSIIKNLTPEEINTELEKWDEVYCPLSNSQKSSIYYDQYKWHVFSYEKYASLDGVEAIDAYKKQEAIEYYVIPQLNVWPNEPGFITDSLPSPEIAQEEGKDFYVYPKNMAWTMAFTHEHGWLGPYFAKHENYNKLNIKNTQALHAKQKGW